MISQTAEYALRATVYLASQGPNPQRTSDISESTKVPQAYLAKVLQGLASKGLVVMRRGVGGGVKLARPSAEMTIFDVIDAIAPIERVANGQVGENDPFSQLHNRLNEAIGHVETAYRSTTLAELVSDQCQPALCSENGEGGANGVSPPQQSQTVSLSRPEANGQSVGVSESQPSVSSAAESPHSNIQ